MLHQVLTALLLMGVCLTVLMVTIVPKATLVAEATPRPSRAPMPIAPRATAELPEMRVTGSIDRWDNEGGASGLRHRQGAADRPVND
jgi:hypothetical protein